MLNHEAMLHDWPRDAHHVGFLKTIGANQTAFHLARNNNHGDGIHVRGRYAGDSIGSARSRGH